VRTTALAITPSQTAQLRCLWPVETRTLTGRRRTNVEKLTDRLNGPIQGAAADGLKLALALLWEQTTECPGAVPVIVCHDEIVVVCDAEQATVAKAWLERAMTEGMDTVLTYAVEPGYRLARRSSLQSLGT
jgi:DNA polymerase-1